MIFFTDSNNGKHAEQSHNIGLYIDQSGDPLKRTAHYVSANGHLYEVPEQTHDEVMVQLEQLDDADDPLPALMFDQYNAATIQELLKGVVLALGAVTDKPPADTMADVAREANKALETNLL